MNVGDKVVDITLVGTIVGVSSADNPVVEWGPGEFMESPADQLIVVEMPVPNDELDPTKEESNGQVSKEDG